MPISHVLNDLHTFDFGPDADPLHDPVYGPDADPLHDPVYGPDADPTSTAAAENAPDDLPPADRAWHLFCQGRSYSAIARELHLDRHTVARYIKQIHDETQADRRADRSLCLTRALGALAQLQATAWDQIALDQGHERVVWDLYTRAVVQSADTAQALAGGYRVRPPTFHARTTRLLSLILAAIRESARLELLYRDETPAREGDAPDEQQQDHFMYIMMRRSDDEALAQMHQPGTPSEPGPHDAAEPGTPLDASAAPTAQPSVPTASAQAASDPTTPPPAIAIRDINGQIPEPIAHPHPALRPDGTDDWYVHLKAPLAPPPDLHPLPGAPTFRNRRSRPRRG